MSNPPEAYVSVIALHQLEVEVHLGVGEEERSKPQKVIIDVRLYLTSLPAAADDDNGAYICYHTLGEKIRAICTAREYRLIEFMTHEIHRALRSAVPPGVVLWIKLRKPQTLLPFARGGSSYTFSDLSPSAWVPPE